MPKLLLTETNLNPDRLKKKNFPVMNNTQAIKLFNENQIKVLNAIFSTFIAELDDYET